MSVVTQRASATLGPGPLLGGLVGACAAFAALYFGIPLLGAVEHGPGIRIGVAAVGALFGGSLLGWVAYGRAMTARADSALVGGASEVLLAHRARRLRARWIALLTGGLGSGAVLGALALFYSARNEELPPYRQLEMGPAELVVSVVFGFVLAVLAFRLSRPGLFVEDDEDAPVASSGAPAVEVSDAELEAEAAKVRKERRRAALASVGSIAVVPVAMGVLAYPAWVLDLGGSGFFMAFAGGIAAGVIVNRLLSPKVDLSFDVPGAPALDGAAHTEARPLPTFEETLAEGTSLQVSRKAGLLRLLGLGGGRRHALAVDHLALGEATERVSPLARLLPAYAHLLPYRVEVKDERGAQLHVVGSSLSPRFEVRSGEAKVGVVEGGFLSRRYRLLGTELELRGSFFRRRHFDLFRGEERVGHLSVRRAESALLSWLTGTEVALDVEVPTDASLEERRLVLAAALVIDHRHY